MKGERVRVILEDRGFCVVADPEHERGFSVLRAHGMAAIARYDIDDTGHWRFGWIEPANGEGRRDALSWHEFDIDMQEQHG